MDQPTLLAITEQSVGRHLEKTVSARDRYTFLEVRRDFTTWIKSRIRQWGFREGRDYAVFDSPVLVNQTGRGGDRRSKDYALTLDMAKHLAMMERNQRGFEAREYFLECERQYRILAEQAAAAHTPPSRSPEEVSSLLHLYGSLIKAHKANGLNQFQAVKSARHVLLRKYQFEINEFLILDADFLVRVGKESNERPTQDLRFWYPDESDDPETKH